MKRSLSILLTLIAFALVPASAGAQEISGVTVKRDGDSVVLTPRDPSKTILVFGCPLARAQTACSPSQLTYLVGEQRFPVKELSRITILEVRKVTELDLSGPEVKELPAPPPVDPKPCFCDKPMPPPPP